MQRSNGTSEEENTEDVKYIRKRQCTYTNMLHQIPSRDVGFTLDSIKTDLKITGRRLCSTEPVPMDLLFSFLTGIYTGVFFPDM